jgi:hypothetical protein
MERGGNKQRRGGGRGVGKGRDELLFELTCQRFLLVLTSLPLEIPKGRLEESTKVPIAIPIERKTMARRTLLWLVEWEEKRVRNCHGYIRLGCQTTMAPFWRIKPKKR